MNISYVRRRAPPLVGRAGVAAQSAGPPCFSEYPLMLGDRAEEVIRSGEDGVAEGVLSALKKLCLLSCACCLLAEPASMQQWFGAVREAIAAMPR